MARQTTQALFESCLMDMLPSTAALVDFGVDGWGGTNPDSVYQAYQVAIKSGKVTIEALDAALGDGAKLSALIGTTVRTVWDDMGEE